MDDRPQDPVGQDNPVWRMDYAIKVSACDNRPGLKKLYVDVYGATGEPLGEIKVRFGTEPAVGIAYVHWEPWGTTDKLGHLECEHLGIPTVYRLFMGDDEFPLIENIRTDFGNEYCKPPAGPSWQGNIPVNRPGICSYRIGIGRKER
jgi:hypothetical protein